MSLESKPGYNSATHTPVYYGYKFEKVPDEATSLVVNDNENAEGGEKLNTFSSRVEDNFNARISHPACRGFVLVKNTDILLERDVATEDSVEQKPSIPEHVQQLPARTYLEEEIFPLLMPALEAMLVAAKKNNVLRWKRTKFNACDYLTEYLYNKNPKHVTREQTDLWEIPFVKKINEIKPRPPLPLSLVWTDDEAAIVLQSCWRGRKVRMDSEVQELRQYQKEMREQEYDIMLKIEDFWKKHPVEEIVGE